MVITSVIRYKMEVNNYQYYHVIELFEHPIYPLALSQPNSIRFRVTGHQNRSQMPYRRFNCIGVGSFRILGGEVKNIGGPNSQQAHDVDAT